MVKWLIALAVIAVISGIFGFTALAEALAGPAEVIFWISAAAFVVLLLVSVFAAKRPPP